jgi:hypothetical protein
MHALRLPSFIPFPKVTCLCNRHRPAVLVEERWSAIPIWLHLRDVRLYAGHIVLLDQSLVDAKVVQSHEGPNQGRTPIKPLAQFAPEHSPYLRIKMPKAHSIAIRFELW